ncbi:helix-turn-helix domain-containing protein [Streptomyces sp. NPDC127106]|uniref:helix-turn-helix domain-containing protein n=1 Tax=Streptomyces sp. NPDC127106 TaxID=3345360 RepID=UPI00362DD18E
MHVNAATVVRSADPGPRKAQELQHRPPEQRIVPPRTPSPGFRSAYGPPAGRTAPWAEAVGRLFGPVDVQVEDPEQVTGGISMGDCGYVRTCTFDAAPHRIRVGGRAAARGDDRHVFVLVQGSGTGLLAQNGGRMRLAPGDIALFSTGGGLTLTFPEPSRVHLLRLPRLVLSVPQADLSTLFAAPVRPSAGLRAVTSPFLAAVARASPQWSAAVGDRVAGHVADVLATLITESPAGSRPADGNREPADSGSLARVGSGPPETGRPEHGGTVYGTAAPGDLAARIRAHIALHLPDSELSPGSIAAAHHVSVRYVHWLFSQEGTTVGSWIRQRRLEEAARELALPGRGDTVALVAQRWGFVSASHFSRVFRKRYGMSPRAWRDSCAPARGPLSAAS